MATITEDYCSFEVAKLLKEKGFNEPCLKQYYNNGELSNVSIEAKYNTIDNQISAPTLQMAMKWLREVHGINLNIVFIRLFDKGYWNKGHWTFDNTKYESYEQACEAAIKYCLENIIK